MMKTNLEELGYPRIEAHRRYQAAASRLAVYAEQLEQSEAKLEGLERELDNAEDLEDPIARVEHMLLHGVAPLVANLAIARHKTTMLAAAKQAQEKVLEEVKVQVNREAHEHFSSHHRVVVRRIVDCLEALHQANKAELQLRDTMKELGYDLFQLPSMQYPLQSNVSNPLDDEAHNWLRQALDYVAGYSQSDATNREEPEETPLTAAGPGLIHDAEQYLSRSLQRY